MCCLYSVVFEILPAKSYATFTYAQTPPINPAQNPATHGAAFTGKQLPMDTLVHSMDTLAQGTNIVLQDIYTNLHAKQYDDEPPNQYGHLGAAGGVNTGVTFTRDPVGDFPAGRRQHSNMVNPEVQHAAQGEQYFQYPNVTITNAFNAILGGHGARFPSRGEANIIGFTNLLCLKY